MNRPRFSVNAVWVTVNRPLVSMTEGRVMVKQPPVSMTESRVTVKRSPVSMTEGRVMVKRSPVSMTEGRVMVNRPAFAVTASRFTASWPAFAMNRPRSRRSRLRSWRTRSPVRRASSASKSPLLLELGAKPRLPKPPRRRPLDEKIADLKEQLAALEAAAEAAKAKKG